MFVFTSRRADSADSAVSCADLASAVAAAQAEVARTDTKAATLLTLATGALAGLLTFAHTRVQLPTAIALWTAAALVTVALAMLLAVIRPRLCGAPRNGLFASHQRLLDTAAADLHAWHADQLRLFSVLAVAKHRRIRAAVDLLFAALAALTVATVFGALS